MNPHLTILQGDCRELLKTLPDQSVQCCVTSPPYWGLRDYGTAKWEGGDITCDHRHQLGGEGALSAKQNTSAGMQTVAYRDVCKRCGALRIDFQLGLEPTPQAYVEKMREVFSEVRRVLRDDGTLWLNLGDSYAGSGKGAWNNKDGGQKEVYIPDTDSPQVLLPKTPAGLKPKDLIGTPWRVAFALQSDGWFLRSEITWCKKAPMPESVTDRPTSATEKIFLFSKSAKYFYDADAVRNPPSESFANDPRWKTGSKPTNEKKGYESAGAQNPKGPHRMFDKQRGHSRRHAGFNDRWDAMPKEEQCANGSNMRNYWVLGPDPFPEAHFATFPSEIPKRCIMAGCPVGGVVLDPFAGSGTTGMVALDLGRKAILIELNPDYASLSKDRCNTTLGLQLP